MAELAIAEKQACASKTSSPRDSRKDWGFTTIKFFFTNVIGEKPKHSNSINRKKQTKKPKKLSYCESGKTQEHVAQRGCRICIIRGIQNSTGQELSNLLQVTLAWAGYWLHNLQSCLPASATLWLSISVVTTVDKLSFLVYQEKDRRKQPNLYNQWVQTTSPHTKLEMKWRFFFFLTQKLYHQQYHLRRSMGDCYSLHNHSQTKFISYVARS